MRTIAGIARATVFITLGVWAGDDRATTRLTASVTVRSSPERARAGGTPD
jgi:hypothetical protein